MDLSSEHWRRITSSERDSLGKALELELPQGFAYKGLRRYSKAEEDHEIALFQTSDGLFSFIPGARLRLGFDLERPWNPTAEELADWNRTADAYEMKETLQEYIGEVTIRPRQVSIPPLLVETSASELGWVPVGVDDPDVQTILRENKPGQSQEYWIGGVGTRVRYAEGGKVVAHRAVTLSQLELLRRLGEKGFRLPSSDEWEYLCGAGYPTLFRWGDHAPCDRTPSDVAPRSVDARAKTPAYVGTSKVIGGRFASDWAGHRLPNAFGLRIAYDTYMNELTCDPGITRGGDGGGSECGGCGYVMSWLVLATAYFEQGVCTHAEMDPFIPEFAFARRVVELR